MGDPRKLKKRYATPSHPWHKAVIEAESAFKEIIAQKVGNALDLKRIEVANSIIKQHVPTDQNTDEEV